MNQNEFDSLIDSLVESVKDYDLDDSFDHYNAIVEICGNCNYAFEYYRAWQLVNFVRFEHFNIKGGLGLFYEVEMEVEELCNFECSKESKSLDDYMLCFAFHILKVATLKKYEALQVKEVA